MKGGQPQAMQYLVPSTKLSGESTETQKTNTKNVLLSLSLPPAVPVLTEQV